MKRLIAIVIAVIAILAMAVPAAAVTTQVTIGTGGGGSSASMPFVVAKFETPDGPLPIGPDDGQINVYPEVSVPPFNTAAIDGWTQINYYLVLDDPQGDADITGADIIISYPTTGLEKYNLHVTRVRGSGPYQDAFGFYHWVVSGGPHDETYPTTPTLTPAVAPASQVRELRYQPAQTWTADNDGDSKLDGVVDGNADGDTNDALIDLAVPDFLTAYGTRVTYGTDPLDGSFTAADVSSLLMQAEGDSPFTNTGKCIMLEIVSYIWCHQDPVFYTVTAKAIAGEFSPALYNSFQFVPVASMYLDFTNVDWGLVSPPEAPNAFKYANKDGDRKLETPLKPTIWNNGNFAGQVSVLFSKMLWNGDPNSANVTGKYLDTFDVNMDYIVNDQTIQDGKIVVTAGQTKVITVWQSTDPVVLAPCTPTQIDFSLLIPVSINPGPYSGTITLAVTNNPGPFPGGYVGYDVGP